MSELPGCGQCLNLYLIYSQFCFFLPIDISLDLYLYVLGFSTNPYSDTNQFFLPKTLFLAENFAFCFWHLGFDLGFRFRWVFVFFDISVLFYLTGKSSLS